ncbi:MAG: helix-turn-helix transcriptional regulator [Smithella sp.]|jgi:transcriptional regulator with XRE-family HTH domain
MNETKGIGQRIKIVRGDKSQIVFAEELGIHRNTLLRYEDELSHPDSDIISQICKTYDINSSWLLFGSGLSFQGKIPIEGTKIAIEGTGSIFSPPKTRPLKIDLGFSNRLKNEIKNSKVSLPLKKERLNEILNGCIPTAKEISDLAKALGVSAIWLAEGDILPRKK